MSSNHVAQRGIDDEDSIGFWKRKCNQQQAKIDRLELRVSVLQTQIRAEKEKQHATSSLMNRSNKRKGNSKHSRSIQNRHSSLTTNVCKYLCCCFSRNIGVAKQKKKFLCLITIIIGLSFIVLNGMFMIESSNLVNSEPHVILIEGEKERESENKHFEVKLNNDGILIPRLMQEYNNRYNIYNEYSRAINVLNENIDPILVYGINPYNISIDYKSIASSAGQITSILSTERSESEIRLLNKNLEKLNHIVSYSNIYSDIWNNEWNIDWNYLMKILIDQNGVETFKNLGSHWLSVSDLENIKVNHLLQWKKTDYIGYCQAFLYPYIAWPSIGEHNYAITGKLNGIIQDLTYKDQDKDRDRDDGQTTKRFSIDTKVYNWYNTSDIRNDLERAKYFGNTATFWKIDSLVMTDNGNIIEIIASRNSKYRERFNGANKGKVWHAQDPSIAGNKLLCVFSDGTIVISNDFKSRNGFDKAFVFECDISKEYKLKEKLYQIWNKNDYITNIGVTLFSLHPKLNEIDLLNEFAIMMNVQIPVCPKIMVNSIDNMQNSKYLRFENNDENIHYQMSQNQGFLWTNEKDYYVYQPLIESSLNRQNSDNSENSRFASNDNINDNINGNGANMGVGVASKIHRTPIDWSITLNPEKNRVSSFFTDFDEEDGYILDEQQYEALESKYKHYLSLLTVLDIDIIIRHGKSYSKSRNKEYFKDSFMQLEIMLQQWLDYHIFQGFDHFYIYDHLFDRYNSEYSRNEALVFYKVLLPYIDNNYVTYIQWPIATRSGEFRHYRTSALLDASRRFSKETRFLTFLNIDDWIVPTNDKYSKFKDLFESVQKESNCNYIQFSEFSALPDVYGSVYGTNGLKNNRSGVSGVEDISIMEYNYKLGCDTKNEENRFDTMLLRHSCLHYKIQNEEMLTAYMTEDIDDTMDGDEDEDSGSEEMIVGESKQGKEIGRKNNIANKKKQKQQSKDFKSLLFNADNSEIKNKFYPQHKEFRFETVFKYLLNPKGTKIHGYEQRSRMLFDPKMFYIGYETQVYNIRQPFQRIICDQFDASSRKHDDDIVKQHMDVILLHAVDHWGSDWLESKRMFSYSKSQDVQLLFNITQSNCDFQSQIWKVNELFLDSIYGQKYKGKLSVDPLIGEDQLFCHYSS